MMYLLLIIIPIIIGTLCLILTPLPIKRNGDIIIIGYPILKKIYNIHQYEFNLRLAQIYKHGHKKNSSGSIIFKEKPFYQPLGSNKVIIYISKKQSTGSSILICSHLVDVGSIKKKALKSFQKIINLFPKETTYSIAKYYE